MARLKTRIASTMYALVVAVWAHAAAPPVTDADFQTWVEESAIIPATMDFASLTATDKSVLDRLIGESRIVYLGEPDHYIREKYDYRLMMIEYLVSRGFRYVGMEMGSSDGERIDTYLRTGDVASLDRVALYGYRGDARQDRVDSLASILRVSDAAPFRAFAAAEREFVADLRRLSESTSDDRLHWFGFDIDVEPGGAYSDLRDRLSAHETDPAVSALLRRFSPVPGETRPQEIARLKALLHDMETGTVSIDDAAGSGETNRARWTIRDYVESLEFIDLATTPPLETNWPRAIREREDHMTGRLRDGWLSAIPDDAKIIMMGHNMHLNVKSDSLHAGRLGDAPSVSVPGSIGSALARIEPVCAVWLLFDRGVTVDALAPEQPLLVPTQRDRVEYLMGRVAPFLILPLESRDRRARYLDEPRNFGLNGYYGSGILREAADAIVFVRDVSSVGER